ncbi:MAG TPA: hypothetical protein VN258_17855 [Mobilitalea sp.]|nr:hypothetical protein [Mobilitalea sp.]
MSKKVLRFTKPITNCYPATSEAAGILFADNSISNWMFNSFIQVFQVEGNNAIDYYDFAIDNNPFLCYNELQYSFVYHNWKSLTEFIKSCIDDRYYVRLFNNMSKNPLYHTNQELQHDILVYGYDDETGEFFVADYFSNGHFEEEKCKYEDLERAVDTFDPSLFETNVGFLNCIQMIQIEENLCKLRYSLYTGEQMEYILSLNLPRIIASLRDYLDCVPTTNWFTRARAMDESLAANHKWGLDCYDVLKLHVENYQPHQASFSGQSFYMMKNHKEVMIARLRKIEKFYVFPNVEDHVARYESLLSMTQRLMLLYYKLEYDFDNERLYERIYRLLDEIKQKDAEYTELLYRDLLTVHELL